MDEINEASAPYSPRRGCLHCARAHKPRFVAGSMGPTNRGFLSPGEQPGLRAAALWHRSVSPTGRGCAEVDLLLVETVFDTLNESGPVRD